MRFLILVLFFTGCAGAPKFQEKSNNFGYTIKSLDKKDSFEVLVELPELSDKRLIQSYGELAANEECLKRGYEYIDYAMYNLYRIVAFCLPTREKKNLNVTFYESELEKDRPHFVVESIKQKPQTKLRVRDEVIAVSGVKLESMPQLKLLVETETQDKDTLSLDIVRDGLRLTVEEPVIKKNMIQIREDIVHLRRLFR